MTTHWAYDAVQSRGQGGKTRHSRYEQKESVRLKTHLFGNVKLGAGWPNG